MRILSWLIIILFCSIAFAAQASLIEVIRLNYADPHSVAHTINSLFSGRVKAMPVPSLNGVAINLTDESELDNIKKLAAVLDRRPATLRFSIQGTTQQQQQSQTLGYHKKGRFGTTNSTSSSTNMRTVLVSEYAKASLTDERLQIYSFPGWYGPQAVAITTTQGLKISGHLLDNDLIRVQVWYAQESGDISEVLLTEVETKAGEWFYLGGLQESSSQTGHQLNVAGSSANAQAQRRKTGGQIDRRYKLRVDLIR